jgi:hypothetical protein
MPVKIVPPRRAWAVRQMARLWLRREDLRRALNDSIAMIDAQNLLLDGLKEDFDKLEVEHHHVCQQREKQQGTIFELFHQKEVLKETVDAQVGQLKSQTLKICSLQSTISSMLAAISPDGVAQAAVDQIGADLTDALTRLQAVTKILVGSMLGQSIGVEKQDDGYTFFAPGIGCIVKVPQAFVTEDDWKKLNGEMPVSGFQVGPYAAMGGGKEIPGIPTVVVDASGLKSVKIAPGKIVANTVDASQLTIDKIEWSKYLVPADTLQSLALKVPEPGFVIENGASMSHSELALEILEKCGVKLDYVETIDDSSGVPCGNVRVGLVSPMGNPSNEGIFAHLKKVSGQ